MPGTRSRKPVQGEVTEDLAFDSFENVSACHVLVLTVERAHIEDSVRGLVEAFKGDKRVPLFGFFRSVRSNSDVRDVLEVEDESGLGSLKKNSCPFHFVAAYHNLVPVLGSGQGEDRPVLEPLYRSPGAVFERLTKKTTDSCSGPLSLFLHTPLVCSFAKTVSPYAWGNALMELGHHIHAIVALGSEGGGKVNPQLSSYKEFLGHREMRILMAGLDFACLLACVGKSACSFPPVFSFSV